MSSRLPFSPLQFAKAVWARIPVASRTVEVNTKTGFSLSTTSAGTWKTVQRGIVTLPGTGSSGTETVDVTVTGSDINKMHAAKLGERGGADTTGGAVASITSSRAHIQLTSATNLRVQREAGNTASALYVSYEIYERN